MPTLKVSRDQAVARLEGIPHQRCRDGIPLHWHVDDDGHVQAQSVCWLYCWGKTGMGSLDAAHEAQRVFNGILDISFNSFDACIDHEWARWARYADEDLEDELNNKLSEGPASA